MGQSFPVVHHQKSLDFIRHRYESVPEPHLSHGISMLETCRGSLIDVQWSRRREYTLRSLGHEPIEGLKASREDGDGPHIMPSPIAVLYKRDHPQVVASLIVCQKKSLVHIIRRVIESKRSFEGRLGVRDILSTGVP